MEPRPIDANVLLEVFEEMKKVADGDYRVPFSIIGQTVRDAKTLDYEPVRHGEIIESNENGKCKRVFSCCGTDFTKLTMWMIPKYCPNCGAKMGKGDA